MKKIFKQWCQQFNGQDDNQYDLQNTKDRELAFHVPLVAHVVLLLLQTQVLVGFVLLLLQTRVLVGFVLLLLQTQVLVGFVLLLLQTRVLVGFVLFDL
jgi:hypothetical protein